MGGIFQSEAFVSKVENQLQLPLHKFSYRIFEKTLYPNCQYSTLLKLAHLLLQLNDSLDIGILKALPLNFYRGHGSRRSAGAPWSGVEPAKALGAQLLYIILTVILELGYLGDDLHVITIHKGIVEDCTSCSLILLGSLGRPSSEISLPS